MKPSFATYMQAIKTGSGRRSGNKAVESRNAGLIPRPSEITVMVRLQLVSCLDPLTRETNQIATLFATRTLVNHTEKVFTKRTVSHVPRPLPSFPSLAVQKSGRGPGTFLHMSDITYKAN